jgi:periplasmic divalent cation tolerance protein
MNEMAPGGLREYFAGRLPERLAEIEEACRAARDAGFTGEPLRTFHRLVHSLAGAGGTFGFPEVSESARELERLLKTFLTSAAAPGEAEVGEIEGFLARLRAIA